MKWVDLGLLDYREGFFGIHSRVIAAKREGWLGEDFLFFQEYYPVVTYGRAGGQENLLVPEEELRARGIQVYAVNRGGNVTYHGPGQLVISPILDLKSLGCGLHQYVNLLEEITLSVLADYGLEARRDPEYTGVWVDEEKIAAIGVGWRRRVVFHGVALNLCPDLEPFSLMVACGLAQKGVTSMERLLGERVSVAEVGERFRNHFSRLTGVNMVEMSLRELNNLLGGE